MQQRAYKKYYARTMRKDMTKAEFEAWTRDAEQKRDAALEPYARAESEEERQRIAAELEENSTGCDASLLLISYLSISSNTA